MESEWRKVVWLFIYLFVYCLFFYFLYCVLLRGFVLFDCLFFLLSFTVSCFVDLCCELCYERFWFFFLNRNFNLNLYIHIFFRSWRLNLYSLKRVELFEEGDYHFTRPNVQITTILILNLSFCVKMYINFLSIFFRPMSK